MQFFPSLNCQLNEIWKMILSINCIRFRFQQTFYICRQYCHNNIRSVETIKTILEHGQPSDVHRYKVYVRFSIILKFENIVISFRKIFFLGLDTWKGTKEKNQMVSSTR